MLSPITFSTRPNYLTTYKELRDFFFFFFYFPSHYVVKTKEAGPLFHHNVQFRQHIFSWDGDKSLSFNLIGCKEAFSRSAEDLSQWKGFVTELKRVTTSPLSGKKKNSKPFISSSSSHLKGFVDTLLLNLWPCLQKEFYVNDDVLSLPGILNSSWQKTWQLTQPRFFSPPPNEAK